MHKMQQYIVICNFLPSAGNSIDYNFRQFYISLLNLAPANCKAVRTRFDAMATKIFWLIHPLISFIFSRRSLTFSCVFFELFVLSLCKQFNKETKKLSERRSVLLRHACTSIIIFIYILKCIQVQYLVFTHTAYCRTRTHK